MTHIMVDLETMGTAPGCPVVSIGAVAFDPRKGELGAEFYHRVSLKSCMELGLQPSADTITWWLQQSNAARWEVTHPNALPLGLVLSSFNEWFYAQRGQFIWSHGLTFDVPILEAAYRATLFTPAWSYRAGRDTRTLFDLTGIDLRDFSGGTEHHALDDARNQARAVVAAYRHFYSPEEFSA